jgi:hypothetical protein
MDSPTNAAPNASVDNELHHDGAEDDYEFDGYLREEAARTAAATHRRPNTRVVVHDRRPQMLGSPFRTPSPGSSKRSYDSMDDDATPTPSRPSQRARHGYQLVSPFQGNARMHQQRQAVALPPVVQEQEQEPEAPAAPLLPSFGALLNSVGLAREVEVVPRLQSPVPLLQRYHLRRAENAAAQPPPLDREHRRLPSPNPGQEHFAFEFHHPQPRRPLLQPHQPPEDLEDILLPPPALDGAPGPHPQLHADFPPRHHAPPYAHHDNYYHNADQEQLPPPPQQRPFPWVHYNDLSDGHREAYDAAMEWEDLARDAREHLDGMMERARARLGGLRTPDWLRRVMDRW